MAGIHEDEWAWAEADRSYRRAFDLNPDSIVSCVCYAKFLAQVGRTSEALTVIEHAAKVNPLSSLVHAQYGYVLHLAGRDDEAVPHYLLALELDPQDFTARVALSMAYDAMGRFEHAVAALDGPGVPNLAVVGLGLCPSRTARRRHATSHRHRFLG
jgi:tetratricopeptide (TPR) repeat protein